MQLVWSLPSSDSPEAPTIQDFAGRQQDMLRAIGAWLDARSYRLARLSSAGSGLIVEVETGRPDDDHSREVFRLEIDALERLVQAARADRDRFG